MIHDKHLLVFLGAPGSGKGTIAHQLIDQHNWDHLSTGDLCRTHIANQTEIGKKIDFAIKSGKLVSDSMIMQMVGQWFLDNPNHTDVVLLDGIPRTKDQAQSLLHLLSQEMHGLKLHVIQLNIPDQAVIDRLSKRYICSNKACNRIFARNCIHECERCSSPLYRRSDDEQITVRERLKTYHEHANEILEYYRERHIPVYNIDAHRAKENVLSDIQSLIKKIVYDNSKK